MHLEPYEYKHNARLMEIVKIAEPWMDTDTVKFDGAMTGREGFTIIDSNGTVQGAITFSDFRPGNDVVVHCTVHPDCHQRWLTKAIYKEVFDYIFVTLDLPRCSGFRIQGTQTPGTFHERLGFKLEGQVRQAAEIDNERRDVYLYGMLRNERRW